ncbi:MAG: 2Fe-2S iron-sulfur cluster-binding protein [Coriobacteriia bacterium]
MPFPTETSREGIGMTVTVHIDGVSCNASAGSSMLAVAHDNGFDIPSLCSNKKLEATGSCRLCVVEVEGSVSPLCTACTLRAHEGLRIMTSSPLVTASRIETLAYLLKEGPGCERIIEIARTHAPELVESGRVAEVDARPACILCGLCVSMCEKLGVGALQFTGKGSRRRIIKFVGDYLGSCINCNACTRVCPTHYIEQIDQDDIHTRSKTVAAESFG